MKKLFLNVVAILLVVGMMTANVSAAVFVNEDFSENPIPDIHNYGSNGYGSNSKGVWSVYAHKDTKPYSVEDGVMKIKRAASVTTDSRADITASFAGIDWEAGENVIMFDFKTGHCETNITMNLFDLYDIDGVKKQDRVQFTIASQITNNRNNVFIQAPLRNDSQATSNTNMRQYFSANEWTTFAIKSVVKDDLWNMKFYIKGEDDSEFTPVNGGMVYYPPVGNSFQTNAGSSVGRVTFISASGEVDFELDNLKVYTEGAVFDSAFEFDGEKVDTLEDVSGAGIISVSASVFDATAEAGSDSTVKKFFVVLDKNMKMLDCKMEDITLTVGENVITDYVEVSDNPDDANYHGNLEGGSVTMHLWNNMQPVCDPIVLE